MSYDYISLVVDNDWELFQLVPTGVTGKHINDKDEIDDLSFVSKQKIKTINQMNLYNKYPKNNVLVGFIQR